MTERREGGFWHASPRRQGDAKALLAASKLGGGERLAVLTPEQLAALVRDAVRDVMSEQDPDAVPEVLDRAGAAQFLGVSLTTLHRLVKSGAVREHRLSDAPRYVRSELLDDLRRAKT
ncbi:MAG TPA: hypothetical protein PKA88_01675 [Polyangiaceae bacterium]|nr:hypothetical protein [Polyangiaceae bacterium]HMR74335.1 hypothetical protein [Polyangiaceae bacterium]